MSTSKIISPSLDNIWAKRRKYISKASDILEKSKTEDAEKFIKDAINTTTPEELEQVILKNFDFVIRNKIIRTPIKLNISAKIYGGVVKKKVGGIAITGEFGEATSGYGGIAITDNCGISEVCREGLAIVKNQGTAIAGHCGTAIAGNESTAISGEYGMAFVEQYSAASVGDYGVAIAGLDATEEYHLGSTASAGENGLICIIYYDGKRKRLKTGYIGEDGLKPNTPYKLDENHNFVKAN